MTLPSGIATSNNGHFVIRGDDAQILVYKRHHLTKYSSWAGFSEHAVAWQQLRRKSLEMGGCPMSVKFLCLKLGLDV